MIVVSFLSPLRPQPLADQEVACLGHWAVDSAGQRFANQAMTIGEGYATTFWPDPYGVPGETVRVGAMVLSILDLDVRCAHGVWWWNYDLLLM